MKNVRPTRSLWLRQALDSEADCAPLDVAVGASRADVVIVGGGFTGLWTALRLKKAEPTLDIALLEADICGGGASGRNGGFALSWWAKFLTLEKLCGTDEALWLAGSSQDAVDELGEFCRQYAPNAAFRQDGWLWAASSEKQVGAWAATLERLNQLQVAPFICPTSHEIAELAGSPRHLAGVLEPRAATVHPGYVVRALRQQVLEAGVRVHEFTPMTDLVGDGPATVKTPRGHIIANTVVLATNAWGIREPEIRKAIVVASSDIVVSPPINDWLGRIGRNDGLAISDSRAMVHYYRTTTDGHMIFGKGGGSGQLAFGGSVGRGFDGRSGIADQVERWMRWTYPDMPARPRAWDWCGPIDKSQSGLPFFGALRGRSSIFYAVGFSGNGVGPCLLGSRILTSLVLQRNDDWARCQLVRPLSRDFPPEPVRYLGGKLVRRAVARLDAAHDAGREGGWITNRLASLAPTALSPTSASD